jgi:hypothetical protein
MQEEEEEADEADARSSHSVGHGPRPVREAERVSVTEGPRVVVTIEF